ncbi:MAG: hypothetical protein FWD16_03725 [Clostridia bacterium]|nr:hypothetical protein [Clostridia bacterium]
MAKFTISIGIGSTNENPHDNEERLAAFALYQKAFNAIKVGQDGPPEYGDIHIYMEIHGTWIMLGPAGGKTGMGFDNVICCEVRFDDEMEFRRAYDVLVEADCKSHSIEGPYPWATLLGLVVDRFGIGWALYFNKKTEEAT